MNAERTEHEQEAYVRGVEAAKAAASWVTDGNTDPENYVRLLKMMDDGDPAADDYLPASPNLSGEWADDLTPKSLYEEITGLDHAEEEANAFLGYETLVGSVIDALANAFEEGVSDTFTCECERLMREAIV